jgi:hypothetical protein
MFEPAITNDSIKKAYNITLECVYEHYKPQKIVYICRQSYNFKKSKIINDNISNIININSNIVYQFVALPMDIYGPGIAVPRSVVLSNLCRECLLSADSTIYISDEITLRPLFINDMLDSIKYALDLDVCGTIEVIPTAYNLSHIASTIIKILKTENSIEINPQKGRRVYQSIKTIHDMNVPTYYPDLTYSLEAGIKKYITHIKDNL